MINNTKETIKNDLTDIYMPLLKLDAQYFDVTVEKISDKEYLIPEWDIQGDVLNIMHAFYVKLLEKQKKAEDELIENLKNDNLEYVIERIGK